MRSDTHWILDMLLAAKDIVGYKEVITEETLKESLFTQRFVVFTIQIIGEAARNVSGETRAKFSNIPWAQIAGMRNRIVHEYFDINLVEVWKVVQDDIPPLIRQLEAIVPPDEAETTEKGKEDDSSSSDPEP